MPTDLDRTRVAAVTATVRLCAGVQLRAWTAPILVPCTRCPLPPARSRGKRIVGSVRADSSFGMRS